MKKSIIAATILLLSSCGLDALEVKEKVVEKFPKARAIVRPAGRSYTYIVVDSNGSVWWAESTSLTNTEVNKIELLANTQQP
jgi:hypothetical protein